MNTKRSNSRKRSRTEDPQPEKYAHVTARIKQSLALMDHAVASAKVDALRLFQEVDRHMRRAREMAERLPSPDTEQAAWCRSVSAIMDALERPWELMENIAALGLVAGRRPREPQLEWLFGDEPETF
jgi:hypothetical protein